MKEELQKAETSARKAWPAVMSWVGGITALIGLFGSLAGGVAWLVSHHRQQTERQAKLALAQAQEKQGEYQASVQTYGDLLKADPADRAALDQQLNTTMLWVEDFHVLVGTDENAAAVAGPALDQIMAILDAGLTRSKGTRAADVQAHIGWAHWLNQHIAEREFGPVAEQNFRAALAADPSNVYANAMLGNWLLQNRGSFTEAILHFNIAVSTGNGRSFVRALQLGGLVDLDEKGARAEVVKAANDMRRSGEPLDEEQRMRILNFCFDPMLAEHGKLTESLSAVPPDEVWQTYLWLDDNPENAQAHLIHRSFIQANLMELSGKRQESLEKYRLLQQELKNRPGTFKDSVDAAIARLSHSQRS
jgi:tetratricopeptide (TPR) repeat protein